MVVGWEALIVLGDLRGLDEADQVETSLWAARALIGATLEEQRARAARSACGRRPEPRNVGFPGISWASAAPYRRGRMSDRESGYTGGTRVRVGQGDPRCIELPASVGPGTPGRCWRSWSRSSSRRPRRRTRARSTRCRTRSPRTSVAAALHPGTPPPGSNDWSCRPSAAHPRPVVLVHGLFANMTDNWQTMSPLLANNGYCVFALTYGDTTRAPVAATSSAGSRPMEQSAASSRRSSTGCSPRPARTKVDIVGHSEGATMPDYYIEYLGGAAKVARYVGVSGVKHGTTLHGIGTFVAEFESLLPRRRPIRPSGSCGSCNGVPGRLRLHQQDRGASAGARRDLHEHLDALRRAREPVHEQLPQRARTSPTSRSQDHCPLDFSDHLSIISSPITGQYILNALDPAHARPVPCTVVAPAA